MKNYAGRGGCCQQRLRAELNTPKRWCPSDKGQLKRLVCRSGKKEKRQIWWTKMIQSSSFIVASQCSSLVSMPQVAWMCSSCFSSIWPRGFSQAALPFFPAFKTSFADWKSQIIVGVFNDCILHINSQVQAFEWLDGGFLYQGNERTNSLDTKHTLAKPFRNKFFVKKGNFLNSTQHFRSFCFWIKCAFLLYR